MSDLQVIHNSENIIVLHKETHRTFIANFNAKIVKYGFGKLNQKEILLNKMYAHEYKYYITPTSLVIYFSVNNGKTEFLHTVNCDETFNTNIDENSDEITIEDLKNLVRTLRHEVSNLKQKNKDLNEQLKWCKEDFESRCYESRC